MAGQPNTGKSTLFNCLTKGNQHVGNWPGKTVEQKTGTFSHNENRYRIVDLPGTYSLTANSLEEQITRDFLINEQPDMVVVMADASQLERSLYLFTEIQTLPVPVVVALNMMDVAAAQGKAIRIDKLASGLGADVVPLTAARGEGIPELLSAVESAAGRPYRRARNALSLFEGEASYEAVKKMVGGHTENSLYREWEIAKFLEQDPCIMADFSKKLPTDKWQEIKALAEQMESGPVFAAGKRYAWISQVLVSAVEKPSGGLSAGLGKFDSVATHPFWGKLMALTIMILGFTFGMAVVFPVMQVLGPGASALADAVRELFGTHAVWLGSLLADGLIPGLAVALMMLAYIAGIYLVFGFLEDVGYLSRLAYVFDKSMTRMGLHGKSFMPLLMSFGCNIAGVTGTRVIDSWQQRMVTMVIVSIIPCLALWGVVSFMGTIFFASAMPLVILSLLGAMVLHLFFTAMLMRRYVVGTDTSGLIMELPPYHKPNWKTIFNYVLIQVSSFTKRAVTLIALLSVVTWALSYRSDGNMELSLLASAGKLFDPVTGFLGLDWRLFVALLASMIAKEASLSVIAVLFGLGSTSAITSFFLSASPVERAVLADTIAGSVSPASALAFIFTFFFTIPCLGTVATIYSETKSLKWTLGSSVYYIVTSMAAGGFAYRVGMLIF